MLIDRTGEIRRAREEHLRRLSLAWSYQVTHRCAHCGEPCRGVWCTWSCAVADGLHREHIGKDRQFG